MGENAREIFDKKAIDAFEKAIEIWDKRCDKKAELEDLVQKWISNVSELSDEELEQQIDKTNAELDELNKLYKLADEEYRTNREKEAMLKRSLLSVSMNLGTNPEEIVITGGVLSSNASESHLIGRPKTLEELESEKEQALALIREKIVNKEITLAQA